MIYLLDTNIVSDIVREPVGAASARSRRIGYRSLGVSAIVAAELRFGVARNRAFRHGERVEALLTRFKIAPFDDAAAARYGSVRAELESTGLPLDGNDLLIAAHALQLGCTLVSADRAFLQVPGLQVENWLA